MIEKVFYFLVAAIAFIIYCFIGFYRVPRKALKKTRRLMNRELKASQAEPVPPVTFRLFER